MDYKYFLKQIAFQLTAVTISVIITNLVMYYFHNKVMSTLQFLINLPFFLGCAIGMAYSITKSKE